jgi:ubiquinone biosynthesis protein Coq4
MKCRAKFMQELENSLGEGGAQESTIIGTINDYLNDIERKVSDCHHTICNLDIDSVDELPQVRDTLDELTTALY